MECRSLPVVPFRSLSIHVPWRQSYNPHLMLCTWTQRQGLRASFTSLPFSIHWKPLQAKIIWKKLPLCITPWAVKNVPRETRGSQSNNFFFWRARYNKSGKRSPHDNKKRKEGSEKSEDSSLLQYKALLICRWESCLCVWNPWKISALSCFSACLNDTIQVHYTAEEGGNRFVWDGTGFFSRNFPTSWPRSIRLCHGTYSKADIPEDSKYTFWTRRLGIQLGQ